MHKFTKRINIWREYYYYYYFTPIVDEQDNEVVRSKT